MLDDKNARVSLRQIIRELEATQATIWSPMILNGGGFGFLANHSLVIASYVSRVNAAIIDLAGFAGQGLGDYAAQRYLQCVTNHLVVRSTELVPHGL